MIVLKSPKGWTGPKVVDGLQIEGTFRSHQVPLVVDAEHPDHLAQLESWMRSYKPEELFDDDGRLLAELAELAPEGDRRMGANPHANGGVLLRELRMPDFRVHAVAVPSPGAVVAQDTLVLGQFLRDVVTLNAQERNFRVFGPDETLSNLLGAVFEVTNRQWDASTQAERRVSRARRDGCSTRCSASTNARAGWRATCSPAATGCSTATRRSFTSSTRCSTSTPSGSKSRKNCRGDARSPR